MTTKSQNGLVICVRALMNLGALYLACAYAAERLGWLIAVAATVGYLLISAAFEAA